MSVLKENKNKSKFNKLIIDVQPQLFSFIFSLVPHKQDAEDILQKTNLILCEKQETFNPELGSFKTWSFKIARYQVMAHKTLHSRSRIHFSNELSETLADEAIDYDTPKIQKNALDKCYNRLPEHMKKIAELRFKKELTMKEISVCTKRPVGAISATLFRIRQNILGCINEAFKEAEEEYDKRKSRAFYL